MDDELPVHELAVPDDDKVERPVPTCVDCGPCGTEKPEQFDNFGCPVCVANCPDDDTAKSAQVCFFLNTFWLPLLAPNNSSNFVIVAISE